MIKRLPKKISVLWLMTVSIMPGILFAAQNGIGDVAAAMVEPLDIAGHLLSDTALLAGLVSLIAGVFRYVQHRQNPLAHPLSTVVTLFLMGIVFVLFPIMYKANEQPEAPEEVSTILQHPFAASPKPPGQNTDPATNSLDPVNKPGDDVERNKSSQSNNISLPASQTLSVPPPADAQVPPVTKAPQIPAPPTPIPIDPVGLQSSSLLQNSIFASQLQSQIEQLCLSSANFSFLTPLFREASTASFLLLALN